MKIFSFLIWIINNIYYNILQLYQLLIIKFIGIRYQILNKYASNNVNTGVKRYRRESSLTDLHEAVVKNCEKSVNYCIANGVPIDFIDHVGQTALYYACERGYTKLVKILLENNARHDIIDINQTSPLWIAAKQGHHDIVLLLLKAGANSNEKSNDGTTALYHSSYEGHTLCVYHLVSYKCHVNSPKNSGASPLFVAARNGHHRIVKCLLKNGADPGQFQKDLRSPLHTALLYNRIRCIRLLLKSNIDDFLEKSDIYGWTHFHFLAKKGHMKGARVLFHYYKNSNKLININQKDCFGNTPLHIAIFNKKIKFTNYLIKKGFNINEENSFGWSYDKYFSKNQEKSLNEEKSAKEYFNNLLLKYHVINTEEVQLMSNEVENYVKELASNINELNSLFENSIIQSGSYYEKTRIGSPDEFDFMINLNKFQNLSYFIEDESDPSGFCRLYPIDTLEAYEKFSSYIDPIKKCLSAEKIRKQFYQLLTSARSRVINKEISSKFKHLKFEWTSGDKRCGTAIHAEWYGQKYPYLSIKIDVVPCLTIYSRPKSINKQTKWEKDEFHVIARSPNINQTYLWRISTSKAELFYFETLNKEQKNGYLILKCLRMLNDVNYKIDKINYTAEDLITSYMFKNEFLYEIIRYPNIQQWHNESLIHRIFGILKRLHKHLIIGSIKSFYIQNYNVIDNDDYKKLRSFEIKYIQNLHEKLKQTVNQIHQNSKRRNTISTIQSITRKHMLRERAVTTAN